MPIVDLRLTLQLQAWNFKSSAVNRQSPIRNPKSKISPPPVFHDPEHHIKIYQGGCLEILPAIPENCVDLIFADPPYFLSNDGITCHAGRMVSVNKGAWDRSRGPDANHEFNRAWLAACQRVRGAAVVGDASEGRIPILAWLCFRLFFAPT